ncbi:MAG: DUF4838 domain-containing protein [Candidatus Brocadiia bacterium]
MKTGTSFLVVMAVLGFVAVPCSAAEFVLTQKGKPAATLVIGEKPSENAKTAAKELQYYVRKISGAELPIVDAGNAPKGRLVLVGRSSTTESIKGLKIPRGSSRDLGEEGFIIWCDKNRLVLAGNDEEPYFGTRYAVCELLHRLGVRWFIPGEFGEVVPERSTLKVPEMKLIDRPSFPVRNFWDHGRGDMGKKLREWKIRNKMNPDSARWIGVPGDSSVRRYLSKALFKEHPEYFALRRNGKRNPHMPCMTSEGMIEHFVKRVKADARNGKRVSVIGADDGHPRCYCEDCMKLHSGFDGMGSNSRDPELGESISQEWFYFIDRILDEVNEKFPNHMIATNGYANRDVPPELEGFNENDNLVVMFANIPACTIHSYDDEHCWQMQRQGRMLKRWCEICDKVWIYNYNYTMLVGKGTLTPMVHRIRANIPQVKEWGAIGFFDQGNADWSMCGVPVRVVRARLEWNVKADVDAILDDYFGKWFGHAAAPMQAYYAALEKAFAEAPQHAHEDVILPEIYSDKLMAELAPLMDRAEKLAKNKKEKVRVRLERLLFDHLRKYVAMEKAKQRCDYRKAAELLGEMMELNNAANKITPFMGYRPYAVYDMDWEKKRMEKLLAKTDGSVGKLIAVMPREARFRTDPHDEGFYARWQSADYDDSDWKTASTTHGWQEEGLRDKQGHPYKGLAWYRMRVDVPKNSDIERARLLCPAVIDEAWVWVNGAYAGRRPYKSPWFRPHTMDMDVGGMLKPGRQNVIALRVFCNRDCFGANGIYERMFLFNKIAEEGSKK